MPKDLKFRWKTREISRISHFAFMIKRIWKQIPTLNSLLKALFCRVFLSGLT